MINPLLSNNTLIKFVQSVNIKEERKDFLISKIPELDEEERISLFKTLTNIYFLDQEEKEAIDEIKKRLRK